MSNVVTATFNNCTFATVTPLYAYDYGQILKIDGVELPASFEVHFCNEGNATTTTQIGSNGEVTIPDAYLETGKNILAYIYLHTGEDDGETEYKIKIPVRKRPQPTHETPTPVQQSEIEQALAALNSAVEEAEDYAEAAEAAAASVHNVPAGGSTNQVLAKNSNDDYDLKWVNQSGGGGGTSDYTELTNKPQIEGVTLSGNKTASDLGLAKTTDIPSVPVQSVNSKTGEVVLSASDVGAYVKPNDGIPKTDLASAVQTSLGKADSALQSAPVTSVNSKTGAVTLSASDVGAGTYSKPSGGIPASDLASAVQTSLGKADTALQSYTETDPTVPSWAKASSKPSYNASEVGAIAAPVSPSSGDFLVYNGSAWAAQAGSGGGGETPLELIASGTLSEDAARIYIDEDSNGNAFALDEDVIFGVELIGVEVFCDGKNIGKITEVLDYPGNSVYVVGDDKRKDRYMIPAVKEFVLSTDLDKNEMQVRLIEGMATDEN